MRFEFFERVRVISADFFHHLLNQCSIFGQIFLFKIGLSNYVFHKMFDYLSVFIGRAAITWIVLVVMDFYNEKSLTHVGPQFLSNLFTKFFT